MEKEDLLLLIESWENIGPTVAEIINNPQSYSVLMEIALHGKQATSWRAAYMVDLIDEKNPKLILPYIDSVIAQLKVENHGGKKRHFLKQISLHEIPEDQFGFLFDYCANAFSSDKEAIAVRVHAMQILFNISEKETELKPEVLAMIEHEMEHHATAGILSRGRKLAAKLVRQIS